MESKAKFKVSLYTCPSSIPINFARHPWFVLENNGEISRYEVLFRKDEEGEHWRKDFIKPFVGIGILPYLDQFAWPSRQLGSIEGGDNSLANQVTNFIKTSKENYPFHNKYSLVGPNSNTYVQWVLNHFPEWKIKLPWNSFGKNYHG